MTMLARLGHVMFHTSMTPKLAELIAYCNEHGIKGSYNTRHDPPRWWARIRVGMIIHSGAADTEDAVLERIAKVALDSLLDPMPMPGSDTYAEWQARQKG